MLDLPASFTNSQPPTRRQWLRLSLGAGLGMAGAGLGAAQIDSNSRDLSWRERRLQGLGTHLHLRAAHADGAQADAGLDAAVAAIRHVERQFSLFDAQSALSCLNRDGVLRQPHPDFVRLVSLAQQISAKSGGAFDVTVQPLWLTWQRAKSEGRLPTATELNLARACIGWQFLQVSTDNIRFKKPGMALTLNGIAQGFAGDLATKALRTHGIDHALLDTGEWSALGHSPDGAAWRLGVADPRDARKLVATLALTLTDSEGASSGPASTAGTLRALATSSDAVYRFSADDRHHHIFDPKTGDSPTGLASLTVLAPTCSMADALTKVMFMGDKNRAIQLAKLWRVEVLAVEKSGRWAASPGLAEMVAKS